MSSCVSSNNFKLSFLNNTLQKSVFPAVEIPYGCIQFDSYEIISSCSQQVPFKIKTDEHWEQWLRQIRHLMERHLQKLKYFIWIWQLSNTINFVWVNKKGFWKDNYILKIYKFQIAVQELWRERWLSSTSSLTKTIYFVSESL